MLMGVTFLLGWSEKVLAKEVKVFLPSAASQRRVSRATSDPTDGERSGKRKMLRASLTPPGDLV